MAAILLVRGARVTRHLRITVVVGLAVTGLGLVHGSIFDVATFAAEMIGVAGVLLMLDLRDDGADVLRDSYIVAALACAGALLVAADRMHSSQHHVALGWVLGPGLAFLMAVAFFGGERRRRWQAGAGATLVFVGAASSGSRASLVLPAIALLVVVLVTARWSLHHKVGFVAVGALGMLVVFPVVLEAAIGQVERLPGVDAVALNRQVAVLSLSFISEDESLQTRYDDLWPATLASIYDNPFGTGFGSKVESEDGSMTYPHNLILEAGTAFGWPGLLVMAAFVMERFTSLLHLARVRPDLAAGGLTAVLGLMISGSMRSFNLVVLTFGIAAFRFTRSRNHLEHAVV